MSVRASGAAMGLATYGDESRAARARGYRGVAMEGSIARWYARTRGTPSQLALWERQAAEVTRGLPEGAEVLEVAPGPGYFAIAMAQLGRVHVSTLDISHTFVEIASENALRAGVDVAIRWGDVSAMPFPDRSFDLVVCQAAFKNFRWPQGAIYEIYRVLRPGGEARIEDMRSDATDAAIRDEVTAMGLGKMRAFWTTRALRSLRRRAYSREQFERFAALSPFGNCTVESNPIGLEVRLVKPVTSS
jgi:ubiquinone/menaquinone biosynthesis C-methylase UbiE